MECPRCSFYNSDDSQVCIKCGEPLTNMETNNIKENSVEDSSLDSSVNLMDGVALIIFGCIGDIFSIAMAISKNNYYILFGVLVFTIIGLWGIINIINALKTKKVLNNDGDFVDFKKIEDIEKNNNNFYKKINSIIVNLAFVFMSGILIFIEYSVITASDNPTQIFLYFIPAWMVLIIIYIVIKRRNL